MKMVSGMHEFLCITFCWMPYNGKGNIMAGEVHFEILNQHNDTSINAYLSKKGNYFEIDLSFSCDYVTCLANISTAVHMC